MPNLTDLEALVTSIGEYTLSQIGRETVQGLSVTLVPRDLDCTVQLVLTDNSSDNQIAVLTELLDIEQMYLDEAIMTFQFVSELRTVEGAEEQVSQYIAA